VLNPGRLLAVTESSRTRRALHTCDSSMVLLPRAAAPRKATASASPPTSPREQSVALTRLSKQLRLSLRLVDRVHRNVTYAACFVAHDAVVWLTNRFDLPRPAAVECGEQLRAAGLIQAALPALRDRPFASDLAFFQFLDVPAPPDPLVEPDVAAARVELGGLRLRAVPDCVLRSGIDLLSLRYNEVRASRRPPASSGPSRSPCSISATTPSPRCPARIGELRLLRRLRVDGNVLRELPAALGQCTQLRTLLGQRQSAPRARAARALAAQARARGAPAQRHARRHFAGRPGRRCTALTELAVDAEFMRFPPADVCALAATSPALLKYLARHEDEQPPAARDRRHRRRLARRRRASAAPRPPPLAAAAAAAAAAQTTSAPRASPAAAAASARRSAGADALTPAPTPAGGRSGR
jgi:hypothetical protein